MTTLKIISIFIIITLVYQSKTTEIVFNTNNSRTRTVYKSLDLKKIDSSFIDINNFDVSFKNAFIDSLIKDFNTDKNLKTSIKKEICGGDCCYSFKKLDNVKDSKILYIFKHDCGQDYGGYGNVQYFLVNNKIKFIREFNLTIDPLLLEKRQQIYNISESQYYFDKDSLLIKEKKIISKNYSEFNLDNVKIVYSKFKSDKLLKEKEEYLKLQISQEPDDEN